MVSISSEVFIGDNVYFYNSKLDEIILGSVEGYYTEDYSILKILQKVSDGVIRHVVPVSSVSKDLHEVEVVSSRLRRERHNSELSKNVFAGCVVHLRDLNGGIVTNPEGDPFKYQVIAVYTKQARVKLVTDYGEEIGMYSIEDVVVTDDPPLFRMENYSVGDKVVWAEYDDVYEGVITNLLSSTSEIGSIRKLYPLDYKRKIPYYKIHVNNILDKDNTSSVLTTIKDIIPREEEDN